MKLPAYLSPILFPGFLAVVLLSAAAYAYDFPPRTRILPFSAALITGLLCVWQVTIEVSRRAEYEENAKKEDYDHMAVLRTLGAILGTLVLAVLSGLTLALWPFTTVTYWLLGGKRVWGGLLLGLATMLLLWFVFVQLLGVPPHRGMFLRF